MSVTDETATRAVLRLLNTPLLPAELIEREHVGVLLQRLAKPEVHDNLSSGERLLADIALSIWTGRHPLGGLDERTRRAVLHVLAVRYLEHPL